MGEFDPNFNYNQKITLLDLDGEIVAYVDTNANYHRFEDGFLDPQGEPGPGNRKISTQFRSAGSTFNFINKKNDLNNKIKMLFDKINIQGGIEIKNDHKISTIGFLERQYIDELNNLLLEKFKLKVVKR